MIIKQGKPVSRVYRGDKLVDSIYRGENLFLDGRSPYSAEATAVLKEAFPNDWETIAEYGRQHTEIVPYVNQYPLWWGNILGNYSTNLNAMLTNYRLVEYLQGNGTQWIDSGMRLKLDTEFEVIFAIESNLRVFGWGSSSNKEACYVAGNSINYSDDWHSSVSIPANDGKWHDVSVRNGEQTFDGEVVGNLVLTTIVNNITLVEFGYRTGWAGVEASACKIQGVRVKDNSSMIIHLPCYNKTSGVRGMYDIVNNSFKTNSGSGTFGKGSDIL